MFLVAIPVLRETYEPVLLARRKGRTVEEADALPHSHRERTLKAAWIRPFKMLCLSPVVPLLGFYGAIVNGIMAVYFATVGTVFQDNYAFRAGQSGLAYLGMATGFVFCQITFGKFSDRYVLSMETKHNSMKPEYRLHPMFIGAFCLPIGIF